MEDLNIKLYEALKIGDNEAIELLEQIDQEFKDSKIIQSVSKFYQYQLYKHFGDNFKAIQKYFQYLELSFQAGRMESIKEFDQHPTLSIDELKKLIQIELKYAFHDFMICLDCNSTMFSWTSATRKTLIDFLSKNKEEINANFSLLFLANDKEIIPPTNNLENIIAELQLLKLPRVGRFSHYSLWNEDLSTLNWNGFRKTFIMIIDDTDLIENTFKSPKSKLLFQDLYKQLIKIHVIVCGDIISKIGKKALTTLTEKTGGLIINIDDSEQINEILPKLILLELGTTTESDFFKDFYKKEVDSYWQKL